MKQRVDYSLYLVTDSTEAILGSKDVVHVVEQALSGGVTIVQYRDKTSDTAALIATATALHARCTAHSVPLIINDRVDVALAVGCEGVHLGQDDMDIATAREMLGPRAIIGATVSTPEEASIAVGLGADYLGIGTLYATATKKNTKNIIGINGVRKILRALANGTEQERNVRTVCIGGINASNLQRVVYQLSAPAPAPAPTTPFAVPKSIDGVAVVSAIMGAQDAHVAACHLSKLTKSDPPFHPQSTTPLLKFENDEAEIHHVLTQAVLATKNVKKTTPLTHNMTNLVVQNFAANVALAIGASPIMATHGPEANDLALLGGALVINTGTLSPETLPHYRTAISAYNLSGGPVVLDPVGAGATSLRRTTLTDLLSTSHFDLIKGNESEILTLAQSIGLNFRLEIPTHQLQQQRGVDARGPSLPFLQAAYLVQRIALHQRCLVLLTGPTDIISNGHGTYSIANGHPYLSLVTGTGCALGTALSAYMAANQTDKFHAALAALLHFEVAAERAVALGVRGPGTFVPAFLDELFRVGEDVAAGTATWEPVAKITCLRDIPDAGLLS